VQRGLAFVSRYGDGRVPDCERAGALRDAATAARDKAGARLGARKFRDALRAVIDFARDCNRYVEQRAPWATRKTDPDATNETVATCLAAAADLAVLLAPFLPSGACRLRRLLGLPVEFEPGEWNRVGEGPGLTPGAPLPAPEILFPKLADAKRKESNVSDDAPKANTPDPKDDPAPAEELISIDDFLKVKLRTAKVLKVEKHPNADRLLKIQVDLGDEQRQIVAGIAAHYTPEQLEGKNVIVVANLKPAKLRGEVSQGMLLAASDGDKVIVLGPDEDCAPGSGIK